MMKTPLSAIALGAAAALFTTAAPAQSDSTSSSSQSTSSLQQANAQEFFRSSDLVGKNTQDAKGNKVGEIKDIVFNQQGKIFAFISVGSGKYAVVPWQAVQAATAKGSGYVTVNATQQQMKAGPAVTKSQWGALNNPHFVQGCYSYYNLQPPTATGTASIPGGSSQSSGASSVSSSLTDTNQTGVSSSSQTDTNQATGAASSPGGSSSFGASSQTNSATSGSQADTNQPPSSAGGASSPGGAS